MEQFCAHCFSHCGVQRRPEIQNYIQSFNCNFLNRQYRPDAWPELCGEHCLELHAPWLFFLFLVLSCEIAHNFLFWKRERGAAAFWGGLLLAPVFQVPGLLLMESDPPLYNCLFQGGTYSATSGSSLLANAECLICPLSFFLRKKNHI